MTPRPPSEPAGRVCPKRCACPVLCPEGADRTGTGAQRSGKRNTHPGAWKTGDPTSFFLPGREDDGRAAHRTASLQVFTQELAQVGETRPMGTGSKGPVPLRPRPHRGTALSFPHRASTFQPARPQRETRPHSSEAGCCLSPRTPNSSTLGKSPTWRIAHPPRHSASTCANADRDPLCAWTGTRRQGIPGNAVLSPS